MTWLGRKNSIKHLGTLHGSGSLLSGDGGEELGPVTYEIDGYLDRSVRTANGQIEGERGVLTRAFGAGGTATIVLADGPRIQVVLSDPGGGPTAEVLVSGGFPL